MADDGTLRVETSFGTLVARRVGDPGLYDEIGIDLVLSDGHLRQVAVVGATEPAASAGDAPGMHVYAYAIPTDESVTDEVQIDVGTPNDGGCWYDGEDD